MGSGECGAGGGFLSKVTYGGSGIIIILIDSIE